ncbi:MAG: glucose 1-dehydrogenase [Pseudomonadota bacterium]
MRLEGKRAIVTGAASGFGEGIASRFASEGATVVVADLNRDGANRVAGLISEAGGKAIAAEVDVADNQSVKTLIDATIETVGGVDIVVNNAGTTHRRGGMIEVEEDVFDRVYAVNVKSLYLFARHAIPVMERGAAFLNIASTAGIRPRPGLVWYNGTKGAAITITKGMAVELAPEGIRVNALNPVVGETGLTAMFLGEDTPEMRETFRSTIPLGRFSTAQDVASAAVYLCSDEAEFITGVCMEVDGGRCV